MKWSELGLGFFLGVFSAFQIALFAFAFYPPATGLVDQVLISYLKDVLGPVFTGFGGASLGALVAYKFQKIAESDKDFKESVHALRLVKFQLINKLSELVSIKKLSVLPLEDRGHRFVSIGPLPESPAIKEQVDGRILNLLADVEAAEAIQELLLGDQSYFACFENFRERNKALYAFRQRASELGLVSGKGNDFRDLLRALEPGRIMALYSVTENMLSVLDQSIQTLDSALKNVGDALDKKFSVEGNKRVSFEKREPHLFENLKSPRFSPEGLEKFIEDVRSEAH
ncbi:hypothetical protein EXN22_08070 [Pseudomonas tructae]|uniref:Uncharacterized protein n=1 Tax=Pseudomonas tructae TaxID=2518644 RepID=A0A411MFP8_9PSED|nr:hypothetical protein [Pseudomonas tructae]QBF25655.1 hypothetical protein EXN22_08070 [Pseudomonas tructae]